MTSTEEEDESLHTIRILKTQDHFTADGESRCPNRGVGAPHSQECILPYDVVQSAASRGCPRCKLYCNLLAAVRPHSRLAMVQNPHNWASPLGVRVEAKDRRDSSMWLHVHYENWKHPNKWQRVDVFALVGECVGHF